MHTFKNAKKKKREYIRNEFECKSGCARSSRSSKSNYSLSNYEVLDRMKRCAGGGGAGRIKSSDLAERFANEFPGAVCRLFIRSIKYAASQVIG